MTLNNIIRFDYLFFKYFILFILSSFFSPVICQESSVKRLENEFFTIMPKFEKMAVDTITNNLKQKNLKKYRNFRKEKLKIHYAVFYRIHDSIQYYSFDKNFCDYLFLDSNLLFFADIKYKRKIFGHIHANDYYNTIFFNDLKACKRLGIKKWVLRKRFRHNFFIYIFQFGNINAIIKQDKLFVIYPNNGKPIEINKYIKNKYSEQEIRNIFIDKKK